MRMPPLPADFIHARACKLKCEKILTRPKHIPPCYCLVKLMRQAAFLACPLKLKERRVPIGTRLLLLSMLLQRKFVSLSPNQRNFLQIL